MKILVWIPVIMTFTVTLHGQQVEFYRENIVFLLSERSFIVNGDYYFRNNAHEQVKKLIYYPFGTFNSNESVDSVTVHNITANSIERILRMTPSGITFEAEIAGNDTVLYRVVYRQHIVSDSVRYILQTTKYWNKPLDRAEYTLVAESPVSVQTLSYPPDTLFQVRSMHIYRWWKEKFLPESDMIIHFRVEGKN